MTVRYRVGGVLHESVDVVFDCGGEPGGVEGDGVERVAEDVANDCGHFGVAIHFGQDALTNLCVTLHLTPLVKRERSGLFKEPGREAHLPDVVDQTTEVRAELFGLT